MLKIAIAIDGWKLPVFERHLKQAGYQFENVGPLSRNDPDMLILRVDTPDAPALEVVVRAANDEAKRTRADRA